jgi:hypothetical protein
MKGKFPCRSPVCSVFAGDLGRAQRRSWTSSLGCLASTCSRVPRARRRRRRPLTITRCTIPGHPRAHIRTKVLLRHILEMPLLGRIGIDLHLGQKPKLGGVCRQLTHLYIIFCRYFVNPCFAFFLSLCCSCFISAFQNTKRPKLFLLLLFCLLL